MEGGGPLEIRHHVVAGLEIDRIHRGHVHELLHVDRPAAFRRQRGHLVARQAYVLARRNLIALANLLECNFRRCRLVHGWWRSISPLRTRGKTGCETWHIPRRSRRRRLAGRRPSGIRLRDTQVPHAPATSIELTEPHDLPAD